MTIRKADMTIEKAENILHTLSPVVMVALWNDYCSCSGRSSDVIYRISHTTINQIFNDKTPYQILHDFTENTHLSINDYWIWVINGNPQSFNSPFYFIRTDVDFLQYLIDCGKLNKS